MSAALEYHRATSVAPETPNWGMDPEWTWLSPGLLEPFHEYGDAERLPLETSVAGPLLQVGAGIVRAQAGRYYGRRTMHWRAYSSAGGLFPVEAYIADRQGLYSFDPLTPGLVALEDADSWAEVASAVDTEAETFVVLTGIHARTGWKYGERGYRHIWWDAGTMLANLLALAAADDLSPRLYTAFVDRQLNAAVGADGVREHALAVLALAGDGASSGGGSIASLAKAEGARFPLAEAAHAAGALADVAAVRAWRVEPEGEEPKLDREPLVQAIRRRTSIREYGDTRLPRAAVGELLAWSEAPVPADAPNVVTQVVTAAAVEGLEPGIYDPELNLLHSRGEGALREQVGFAAMEQDHPRDAAVNVFQLAHIEDVVERLGDRGYRWAQLEAGIRAGRLQVGAFVRGWGAAASTFYDSEVPRLLETDAAPMLMVAIGPR